MLKWNGWGYRDSGFRINDNGHGEFTGNRYGIAGKELPRLVPFMDERGFDKELQSFSQVSTCQSIPRYTFAQTHAYI